MQNQTENVARMFGAFSSHICRWLSQVFPSKLTVSCVCILHFLHIVPSLSLHVLIQASRSPAMPRTAEFFLAGDGEEDEVEFTDNDAYESASPQPQRRDLPLPNPSPSSSSTLPQSYTNLSVASFPRGQSASPVLPRRQEERRGSTQSTGSGVNEGPPPRFEISRQQDSSSSRERGGRGAVFETVTIRSHV